MTPFWILGAALLVLASLALIVPLWRGEGRQSISRSALNKQLYRQRLLEIGEEREQGILAEEPESLVELQRSLLDDIPDVEQTARARSYIIPSPHSSTNNKTLSIPDKSILKGLAGSPFLIIPLLHSSFRSPNILN